MRYIIYTLALSIIVALPACIFLLDEADGQESTRPDTAKKVTQKPGEVVIKMRDGSYKVRNVGAENPARAARQIEKTEPDVEVAGPNLGVPVDAESISPVPQGETVSAINPSPNGTIPSDPKAYDQQNLTSGPMNFDAAWAGDGGSKGNEQVVGIVDTGFQQDHPDLASKFYKQYDFVNNDSVADPYDWHGSAVSSVAAAQTNNNEGMAGAGWNATFAHAKACDYDPVPADVRCYSAATAPAVDWLVAQGVKQINLSFGAIDYDDPVLKNAVSNAQANDVLVVASMGNDGQKTDTYGPACWQGVLGVGGTNRDATAWYADSNYGTCLDVAGPSGGGNTNDKILAAMKLPPNGCEEDGVAYLYCYVSGTSFGAPHVAATSALVRAKNPSLTQSQVASKIVTQAKSKALPGLPADTVGSVKVLSAKCTVKPGATGC